MTEEIVVLDSDQSIQVEQVEEAIERIWGDLLNDQEFVLAHPGLKQNPFLAERKEGQFGVAETIAIGVLTAALKDIASSIWKDFVWPKLKRRFGTGLDERDAPQD